MRFQEFYDTYRAELRNYICRKTWNIGIWDDVEQATWIKIARRWREFDCSRPFLPWAKGDYLNARRDLSRQEVNEQLVKKDAYEKAKKKKEAEELILSGEFLKVDEELYEVFIEHYFHKKTLGRVAKNMGMSYNKIIKLNRQIKDRFKEKYG